MKNRKQNFLVGAFILSVGGILAKFLGVFFRIPLTNHLGNNAMGLYMKAYPIYSAFLSLSTVGLPTAISKLVSEKTTLGLHASAKRIYRVSTIVMAALGAAASLMMFFGAGLFEPEIYYCILALSPAPFMVALISSVRGFFQGVGKMAYSAVSQIIDQLLRVGVGVLAGFALYDAYIASDPAAAEQYSAAGASFGASAGAAAALVFLYAAYAYYNRSNTHALRADETFEPGSDILKKLARIALPIAFGSVVTAMMGMINSFSVTQLLERAGTDSGEALSLYSLLENSAQTVINVPFVVGQSLAASLVPAISASFALRKRDEAVSRITLAIKSAMLIGIPASVGLSVLSGPIMMLLFPNKWEASAQILQWLSFEVIFSLGMTTTTGILQGAGHYYKPIKNMFFGMVCKILLNVVLIPNESLGIYGAVVSNLFATALIFGLNYYDVKEHVGVNPMGFAVIRMVVFSALMGLTAVYTNKFMTKLTSSTTISLAVSIVAAMAVYFTGVLLTRTITRKELQEIRG